MRLAVLFAILAFPILEIALLIKAGQRIGALGVFGLIIVTGVLGVWAIRRHGLVAARRMAEAAERGEAPAPNLLDGALVVLAGMLLVAPGLITDTLGLTLLFPAVRRAIAAWSSRALFPHPPHEPETRRHPGGGSVIDGEFERLDEHDLGPR
jgi:UPF0716 protein FxsA